MWTSDNAFQYGQIGWSEKLDDLEVTWPAWFPACWLNPWFSVELIGGFLQEPEEILCILWRSAIRVVQMLPKWQTDMWGLLTCWKGGLATAGLLWSMIEYASCNSRRCYYQNWYDDDHCNIISINISVSCKGPDGHGPQVLSLQDFRSLLARAVFAKQQLWLQQFATNTLSTTIYRFDDWECVILEQSCLEASQCSKAW